MNETPLEANQIQLTSKHRLKVDKYNFSLSTRYQMRSGKGRNADYIDSYNYGDEKHYGHPLPLVNRLLDSEFRELLSDEEIKNIDQLIEVITNSYEHINKVAEDLKNHINEHITIDLGESTRGKKRMVKGMEISEDE